MATNYEGFYDGGVSALNPEYGTVGYHMSAAQLGFPGSPQTANQLGDTINAIKHGTRVFEVTMLQPDVGETIPTQHFDEMRALMKLTGVKPSLHAPVIDAVGFGEKGWGKEEGRMDNERRMFNAIEKAQRLDPSGNIPIVFHATNGTPGSIWRPGDKSSGEKERILESGSAINMETGQVQTIKREFKFRPEYPELLKQGGELYMDENHEIKVNPIEGRQPGKLFGVEGSIDSMNNGEWENKLMEVAQMAKHSNEIIGVAPLNLGKYTNAFIIEETGEIIEPAENGKSWKQLPKFDSETEQVSSYNKIRNAGLFVENAELAFVGAFNQAYKYGKEEQKEKLERLSKRYSEKIRNISDVIPISKDKNAVNIWAPVKKQELLEESLNELKQITRRDTPSVWRLSEDLALDEASKTFGNLASKSYAEFQEKSPVIAIENPLSTQAISSADSLKKLVEKSRENFEDYLVKEKGINKNKAKELAKKKIGVTWDIGHLNLVKGQGFDDTEVLRQTKLITEDKSMVKHVHLTDNFGYADTHLVPGMGNVPVKEILEQLEKTGRFDEMRKITEAGGMIQHFKKLPHSMTLAAFGSGIYGIKNSPTWNQAIDIQGNYFGGYGTLNPQTHHAYFGAGFTTMPVELGGQMAGGQSRFGGAPMA